MGIVLIFMVCIIYVSMVFVIAYLCGKFDHKLDMDGNSVAILAMFWPVVVVTAPLIFIIYGIEMAWKRGLQNE